MNRRIPENPRKKTIGGLTGLLLLFALCLLLPMAAAQAVESSPAAEAETTRKTTAATQPKTTEAPETDAPTTEAPTTEPPTEDPPEEEPFRVLFQPYAYDGITQDQHIIEIFNKYGFKGCTFFINTGLFGANWTWVGETLGMPSLTHKRWTKTQFQTGIYDGFDVACHTVNHGSLKNYDEAGVINEVQNNADDIYALTGIYPLGMAWPGGDTEYTNKTVDIVSGKTSICFSRGVSGTNKFTLPKYWLKWMPTTTFGDGNMAITLAKKFLKTEATSDMVFYVWGHGYELDFYNSWDKLDELIKMMTEAEDVVIVTNSEFYWLFKDEIPKWK